MAYKPHIIPADNQQVNIVSHTIKTKTKEFKGLIGSFYVPSAESETMKLLFFDS